MAGDDAGETPGRKDRGRLTQLRFIASAILLGGAVLLLVQAATYHRPATDRITVRAVLGVVPSSADTYANLAIGPAAKSGVVSFQDANGDGVFTDGTDPKYRLGPAVLTEARITGVRAVQVIGFAGQNQWAVEMTATPAGATRLDAATSSLAPAKGSLAAVVDGVVRSALTVPLPITRGVVVFPMGSRSEADSLISQMDVALDAMHGGTGSARVIEGVLGGVLAAAGLLLLALTVRSIRSGRTTREPALAEAPAPRI